MTPSPHSPDDPNRDNDQDEHTRPGIARPGQQPDQQPIPGAPPQPAHGQRTGSSSQWIPPTSGNPDLDPAGQSQGGRVDLREHNPLTPQGMLYDPRQLLEHQRRGDPSSGGNQSYPNPYVPEGARFDPFGPPDPSQVGPGRGPMPGSQFGNPDPDHFQPPGQPQAPNLQRGKGLGKMPWPPGGGGFPPPGGPPPFI